MFTCLYRDEQILVDGADSALLRKLSKGGNLACPECKDPVVFKCGKYVRSHFAHLHGKRLSCQLSQESIEHQIGKKYIYELLSKQYDKSLIYMEKVVNSGQRADVLLQTPNNTFAFEVQFSSQDGDEWEERSTQYQQIGITPIWILGYRTDIEELKVNRNSRNIEYRLGRTRERALINSYSIGNIINRLSGWWFNSGGYGYKVVHLVTITNSQPNLHIGYLKQKSKIIYDGWFIPIQDNWLFDEKQGRFIPEKEISVNAEVEKKLIERKKQLQEGLELQNKLQKLVLQYTKHKSLYSIPFVVKHPDIFFDVKEYDNFLLLQVAIYIKFIRGRKRLTAIDIEDEISSFVRDWGFSQDYNHLLDILGDIEKFFERLQKEKILKKSDARWYIVCELNRMF